MAAWTSWETWKLILLLIWFFGIWLAFAEFLHMTEKWTPSWSRSAKSDNRKSAVCLGLAIIWPLALLVKAGWEYLQRPTPEQILAEKFRKEHPFGVATHLLEFRKLFPTEFGRLGFPDDYCYLTEADLRGLIGAEAATLGMTFDQALRSAEEGALAGNLGAELSELVGILQHNRPW
jgi:hypothetical protein